MDKQQLEIKELWNKIQYKTGAVDAIALEFDRIPRSLQANWLCDSGRWSVPKRFRSRVIKTLKDRIKKKL